jgi:hypothetical protein
MIYRAALRPAQDQDNNIRSSEAPLVAATLTLTCAGQELRNLRAGLNVITRYRELRSETLILVRIGLRLRPMGRRWSVVKRRNFVLQLSGKTDAMDPILGLEPANSAADL